MFCNVYTDKKNPINTVDGHTHTVYYGGVIFEENKLDTYCMWGQTQIVLGPQFQNFTF